MTHASEIASHLRTLHWGHRWTEIPNGCEERPHACTLERGCLYCRDGYVYSTRDEGVVAAQCPRPEYPCTALSKPPRTPRDPPQEATPGHLVVVAVVLAIVLAGRRRSQDFQK